MKQENKFVKDIAAKVGCSYQQAKAIMYCLLYGQHDKHNILVSK